MLADSSRPDSNVNIILVTWSSGIILVSMREVLSSVLFLFWSVTPSDLVSCFCATSRGLKRRSVFSLVPSLWWLPPSFCSF